MLLKLTIPDGPAYDLSARLWAYSWVGSDGSPFSRMDLTRGLLRKSAI